LSQFRLQQPVRHIPSFKEYKIYRGDLVKRLYQLDIDVFPKDVLFVLDKWYYHTDLEGWGKVLENLIFSSNLYKKDKFDCEDYALKAQVICAQRYGLNALRLCIGDVPTGKHGFNIFYFGDGFMLFEPNAGFTFSGSAFEIGEYGYKPEIVLV